jgi:microcystin-dependent protein
VNASTTAGNSATPQGGFFAAANNVYTGPNSLQALNAAQLGSVGGSQPHDNMQPYLVLNFVIALQGIFPSQN